jgi:hypothetical protein
VKREAEDAWGKENMIMRSLIIAAAVVATTFVLPADARPKKPKHPALQTRQASPSLDRMECDGFGTPYGPYCH